MVELWNKLKLCPRSGEGFYDNERIFSKKQLMKEFKMFPFGEWVLLIDQQLMPLEALANDLSQNRVQLSGLVFDVSCGQDFYCDLNFVKNQLVNVRFGLTQATDLSEQQIHTHLLAIKQWFETQGFQMGSQMNEFDWTEALVKNKTVLTECLPWGWISVSHHLIEGIIKIEINYELDEVGSERNDSKNH